MQIEFLKEKINEDSTFSKWNFKGTLIAEKIEYYI